MMVLSSILGMTFTTAGLWLSYWLNLTSGATIILVAEMTYLLSITVQSLAKHTRTNQMIKEKKAIAPKKSYGNRRKNHEKNSSNYRDRP